MPTLLFPTSFFATSLLLALAPCTAAGEARLFILSGQSNMAGLDPEVSFLPELRRLFPDDEIVCVKDAQGGQPIRRWFKAWTPPSGNSSDQKMGPTKDKKKNGDLYDRLMKKVHPALEGREYSTICFVWMQGERDAREGHGAVYKDSLLGLLKQLKKDLNRQDISWVVGRLSDFSNGNTRYKHWDEVRAAQVEAAKSDPQARWIDTDDLNGKKNDLHYDEEGYKELGRRFARACAELIAPAKTKHPSQGDGA